MKKLLLISGHGHGDPGACATLKGKHYSEAEETIVMVKKIRNALKHYNVDVDLYDTSRNAYEDLKAGKSIRFRDYDYTLEIHFNSCVHDLKGNGKTTGTEILLPTYNNAKAGTLENAILKNVAGLGLKNRGTKNQQLLVINTAARQGMKASLLEVCFIDDLDDMKIYLKDKAAVAKAIADAFISTWKLKMIATTTEKVMFRSSKKVDPSTNIKWIKAGTTVEVINIYQKWLKIKYDDKTGYIVKSKTTF